MKKLFRLASLALLAVLLVNCRAMADTDKVITQEELPQEAKSFLKSHFAQLAVSFVKQDSELLSRSYEVLLENGTVIEFDRKGQWQEVNAKGQAIPTAFIPAAILGEVKQRFPQQVIVKIEKSDRGRYEVGLSNGLELTFGRDLKLITIDND